MTPALNVILFGGAPNPVLSADFVQSVYRMGTGRYTSPSDIPGWSFTRASVGTALNAAGQILSFASGQPRITDLGILIEEARTNGFLNSAVGVTQSVTTTAASWTLSFYGTGSITMSGGATGTLNGTGANNRVSLTVTALAIATLLTVSGSCTNVQFEAGAFATSVIVTAGAAATRAADIASISGLAPQTAGTWKAIFRPLAVGSYSRIIAGPASGPNVVTPLLIDTGGLGKMQAYDGADIAVTANTVTLNAPNSAAMAYDGSGTAVALNGGTVATGAAGADFAGQTFLYIGTNSTNAVTNGYYAQILRLASRTPNAQLQAMTQ